MESRDNLGRDDALDAMRTVESARRRLAKRLTAPWWYKAGIALCVAAAFTGAGLQFQGYESLGTSLILVGAIIAPIALVSVSESRAGISADRYKKGLGWWWPVSMIALFIACALIQTRLEIPYAMFMGAAVGVVATLLRENQYDSRIRSRANAREL